MVSEQERVAAEPTPPGRVLRQKFLEPLGIGQVELARALGISRVRVNQVLNGRCVVTPAMALRLGRLFGTGAEFWLGLQMHFDLEKARHKLADQLEKIEPLAAGAPAAATGAPAAATGAND